MAFVRDAREQQLKLSTQSVCFLVTMALTVLVLQRGNVSKMAAGVATISFVRVKNARHLIITAKKRYIYIYIYMLCKKTVRVKKLLFYRNIFL